MERQCRAGRRDAGAAWSAQAGGPTCLTLPSSKRLHLHQQRSLRGKRDWVRIVVHVASKTPEHNLHSRGSGEIDWLSKPRIGIEVGARLGNELKRWRSAVKRELERFLTNGR